MRFSPKKFVAIRHVTGMSQEEFGEFLGVAGSDISRYECGVHEPRKGRVKEWADKLEVSINDFYVADDPDAGKVTISILMSNYGVCRVSLGGDVQWEDEELLQLSKKKQEPVEFMVPRVFAGYLASCLVTGIRSEQEGLEYRPIEKAGKILPGTDVAEAAAADADQRKAQPGRSHRKNPEVS